MSDLSQKKCAPCEGGIPALEAAHIKLFLKQVPGWEVKNGHLMRHYQFKDFKTTMQFLNKVAEIAEAEGHHPDFTVHYNKVDFDLWTHAVNGLSENDFILAAKIEATSNTFNKA